MDQNLLEETYLRKVAAEFEVFVKRKFNIQNEKRAESADTTKIEELDRILEDCRKLEKAKLEELYRSHAEMLQSEIIDGTFRKGKKCEYCKRFYQDYEHQKAVLPCEKMEAYSKMMKGEEKLTMEEYKLTRDGQYHCKDLFLPCTDQEKIDEEMNAREQERWDTIEEWLDMALFELDNL